MQVPKLSVISFLAIASFAVPQSIIAQPPSTSKTVTTKVGESHFEAALPSGLPLRLYLRSGEIRIVSRKNSDDLQDIKHRLNLMPSSAEFHLTGGPMNDVRISIRIPKNSGIYVRVPAGDVTVEGISGDKDIELHAGDLSIHIGNPEDYSHVDASVSAGDVDAAPFGESRSGLFRSFTKSGSGKYKLHAHVGAGDVTLL
jgi:hypothetical protein